MDKYNLIQWLDYAFLTLEQKIEEEILELEINQYVDFPRLLIKNC